MAKWLLESVDPWLMAGLLYLGSGLGLALYRLLRRMPTGIFIEMTCSDRRIRRSGHLVYNPPLIGESNKWKRNN